MEPQIGRQLCSVELREEAGGRGRWGVQLADGLRLMKWIMRGARAGFHAKKRRKKRERLLPAQAWTALNHQEAREQRRQAQARASFSGVLLDKFLR